jgi:hypothetical protein
MSTTSAETKPSGALALRRVRSFPPATSFRAILGQALPRPGLEPGVAMWRFKNIPNVWRGFWRVAIAKTFGIPTHYGALYLKRLRPDGTSYDLGLASLRVVTTTGVGFIVDAFQNIVELEAMNFHGFGTGGTAEAVGNTALTTELTTQYVSDNTRLTGTQSEAAANIYRTVATLDPDADVAITEHGIFSVATVGSGVMLDRTLFSVVNLTGATGDALQATYDFTCTSGG